MEFKISQCDAYLREYFNDANIASIIAIRNSYEDAIKQASHQLEGADFSSWSDEIGVAMSSLKDELGDSYNVISRAEEDEGNLYHLQAYVGLIKDYLESGKKAKNAAVLRLNAEDKEIYKNSYSNYSKLSDEGKNEVDRYIRELKKVQYFEKKIAENIEFFSKIDFNAPLPTKRPSPRGFHEEDWPNPFTNTYDTPAGSAEIVPGASDTLASAAETPPSDDKKPDGLYNSPEYYTGKIYYCTDDVNENGFATGVYTIGDYTPPPEGDDGESYFGDFQVNIEWDNGAEQPNGSMSYYDLMDLIASGVLTETPPDTGAKSGENEAKSGESETASSSGSHSPVNSPPMSVSAMELMAGLPSELNQAGHSRTVSFTDSETGESGYYSDETYRNRREIRKMVKATDESGNEITRTDQCYTFRFDGSMEITVYEYNPDGSKNGFVVHCYDSDGNYTNTKDYRTVKDTITPVPTEISPTVTGDNSDFNVVGSPKCQQAMGELLSTYESNNFQLLSGQASAMMYGDTSFTCSFDVSNKTPYGGSLEVSYNVETGMYTYKYVKNAGYVSENGTYSESFSEPLSMNEVNNYVLACSIILND